MWHKIRPANRAIDGMRPCLIFHLKNSRDFLEDLALADRCRRTRWLLQGTRRRRPSWKSGGDGGRLAPVPPLGARGALARGSRPNSVAFSPEMNMRVVSGAAARSRVRRTLKRRRSRGAARA